MSDSAMIEFPMTIAKNGTTSDAFDTRNKTIAGFRIAASAMDSATITVYGSETRDGTYNPLQKSDWSGNLATSATTGDLILVIPYEIPFRYLKLVTGAAQSTAAVSIKAFAK